MFLFFVCDVWTMISYYSSLLLTIRTSHEVYKPRLEMILNDMVYWSTNVVYWHKLFPLSPMQTEFLTSVLSLLSLDVILSGMFFLLYWEYSLRCSYRDIPIYLLWNTILCTNLLISKDCVASCSFPYTVHHVMEARFLGTCTDEGGRMFRQSIVVPKKTLFTLRLHKLLQEH